MTQLVELKESLPGQSRRDGPRIGLEASARRFAAQNLSANPRRSDGGQWWSAGPEGGVSRGPAAEQYLDGRRGAVP